MIFLTFYIYTNFHIFGTNPHKLFEQIFTDLVKQKYKFTYKITNNT